jgi:hypothetical protein
MADPSTPQEQPESDPESGTLDIPLPSPPVAAVAVIALLAFGVLLGSAISPVGQSGADKPRLLVLVRAASPRARRAVKPPPVSETPTPTAAAEAAPAPAAAPATTTETVSQSTTQTSQAGAGKGGGSGKEGGAGKGGGAGGGGGGEGTSGAGGLPPVKHVFLIVLSDQGATAAFGPNSPAPYLAKTLPHEGELLENYYAVAGGELANAVALIAGQGPTPQTAADCPLYTDITPGSIGAEGQVLGSGCVYPRQTLTVADQLTAAHKTWKAYVEGIEAGSAPGQAAGSSGQAGGSGQAAAGCRHPAVGAADPDNAPSLGDAYVTWRNPFVYFHSLIDTPACAQNDVGMPQLASDLKAARSTPSLAYIVPDRCHDGSEAPCAPGQPAGLAAAETFLRKVVPQIRGSAAYREGGLIAITFDQAPQAGPGADSSGCCTTSPYPNLPAVTTTATGTTSATTTPAPAAAGTTGAGTTGAGTTSTGTTGASTTTTGAATPAAPGSPVGGGRVGLLLISKYVKPGTLNLTGEYNHFALLRSIENLFSLKPLGYAGAQGLLAFDSSVFNAGS